MRVRREVLHHLKALTENGAGVAQMPLATGHTYVQLASAYGGMDTDAAKELKEPRELAVDRPRQPIDLEAAPVGAAAQPTLARGGPNAPGPGSCMASKPDAANRKSRK
jgi:hypothetical protein